MSKGDKERQNFLSSLEGSIKKPRPEPEKRDVLGNKVPEARRGRQALTTWLNPAVIRQFKTLAFNQDKSQQDLMEEALNLLFKHYGQPEIA